LFEARREIIDRLQTEERIKSETLTPLDLAWTKWLTDYSGLRRDKESPEQDLQSLRELKYYGSYGGYYPLYKKAGLTRQEAKLARTELNKKINYLEGLEKTGQGRNSES